MGSRLRLQHQRITQLHSVLFFFLGERHGFGCAWRCFRTQPKVKSTAPQELSLCGHRCVFVRMREGESSTTQRGAEDSTTRGGGGGQAPPPERVRLVFLNMFHAVESCLLFFSLLEDPNMLQDANSRGSGTETNDTEGNFSQENQNKKTAVVTDRIPRRHDRTRSARHAERNHNHDRNAN